MPRFVFISDTHTLHDKIKVPDGDVLIHCGDFTSRGSLADVRSFARFMAAMPHRKKIAIAGNHDFCFENELRDFAVDELKRAGVRYLEDSGCMAFGYFVWGSPVTPEFHNWAFNRSRGRAIRRHWDLIPEKTDILVTHGPPAGILDEVAGGESVGCEELYRAVERVSPTIHAFGHIHEGYGMFDSGATKFVNASSLNEFYEPLNPAIALDLPEKS